MSCKLDLCITKPCSTASVSWLMSTYHGSLLPVARLNPLRCCKLVASCAVCCRDDLFTSMLPKYHDILRHQADLDILIFSGDVDGIVPVIGTRRWLASLELPIIKEWRPWYSHSGNLPLTLHSFTHLPCNVVKDHTILSSLCMRSRLAGQQ